MSQPLKKTIQTNPESYSPQQPMFLHRMQELCAEKIRETVVIESVDFQIIEKAKTLYAGSYFIAPDCNSEPDVEASWKWFQNNKGTIRDSVTPDCMICLSIDYATNERPCAMLHGQETVNANQPEGVHVMEAAPTLLIRVKSTDAAWALTKKITGEDNPQWHMAPLFGLIRRLFCDGANCDYVFNGCNGQGNEEAEYYYDNGDQYVTVPVKRRNQEQNRA